MKILLTGFAPFGGQTLNPSYEAVRRLPDRLYGAELVKAELPVEYDRMDSCVADLLSSVRPDGVIALGQAGGRTGITPELVALNLIHSDAPDNAGTVRRRTPVLPGGPAAYFTTLPVFAMVDALRAAGLPASLSYTAGSYVCNALFYALMARTEGKIPAGFIHVPYLPSQTAGNPAIFSMELPEICRALEICIKTLTEHPESSTVYLENSTLQN